MHTKLNLGRVSESAPIGPAMHPVATPFSSDHERRDDNYDDRAVKRVGVGLDDKHAPHRRRQPAAPRRADPSGFRIARRTGGNLGVHLLRVLLFRPAWTSLDDCIPF